MHNLNGVMSNYMLLGSNLYISPLNKFKFK